MGESKSKKGCLGKRTREDDARNNEICSGLGTEDGTQGQAKHARFADKLEGILENAESPISPSYEETPDSPSTPYSSIIIRPNGSSAPSPPSIRSEIPTRQISSPAIGENGLHLVGHVEAGQLSRHRRKNGPIYEASSFEEGPIMKRLKDLASSSENPTIEMGLEMADGAYLMQIMTMSNPADGIEKAWQKAYTGATLLLQGRRLLEDCRDILKSVFQSQ